MIKAVLFDFDGVIVQTAGFRFVSIQNALKKYDYKIDDSSSNSIVGKTTKNFIRETVGILSEQKLKEIVEESHRIYFDSIEKWEPIDGINELVKQLSRNFTLAIESTAKRKFIDAALNHLNLTEYFRTISSGDDVANKKPDPAIYLNVINKLETESHNCIAIEDSETGVEAAKTAGIKCIALKHEEYPQNLSKADLIVNNLREITLDGIIKLGN